MIILSDNNKSALTEYTVSEKEAYTGKYISLKVMTIENQKGYAQREIVEHSGTISVVAITPDNKIVLNRIYRKTIDDFSVEIPSKKIDSTENYLEVIRNEMTEKLGYEVENVRSGYNFYTSIAYSTEKVYMYVTDVKKIQDINNDDNQEITTVEVSLEDIYQKMEELNIIDSKTIIAINYIKNNL